MTRRVSFAGVVAVVSAMLLLFPTLAVIPVSFTSTRSFELPPPGWSLDFYRNLFTSPAWQEGLIRSLWICTLVAVVATALGWMAAEALTNRQMKGARVLEGVLMLPVIVPGIIGAVALYSAFLRWQVVGTNFGFFLADLVLTTPLAVVAMTTGLRDYDSTFDRAAETLGAGPVARLLRIKLPLLMPAVFASIVMCFVVAFDEVVVGRYIQSPTVNTLPVVMYSSVQEDIDPTIAAASTFMIFAAALLLLASWALRRKGRR
ncbi:MAG: ABC transporter permease [Nocardioidaceae bacterium]